MNEALTRSFIVPADHPSLAGHFPGHPLVPGVVLLDAVREAVQSHRPGRLRAMPSVKFLRAVLPDERLDLQLQFDDTRARFRVLRAGETVLEGVFVLSEPES